MCSHEIFGLLKSVYLKEKVEDHRKLKGESIFDLFNFIYRWFMKVVIGLSEEN